MCLNCCIDKDDGKVTFMAVEGYGEMLSGITKFFDEKHLHRIDSIINEHGGNKQLIEVASFSVSSILQNQSIIEIDYCNIDVEGGEMSVLKSIDFSNVQIKLFTIENNYNTNEVHDYLKPKGYSLIGKLGADEIYELNSKKYLVKIYIGICEVRKKLGKIKRRLKGQLSK